ncbi:MAG: permease [Candidatus Dormibacteria bacterium]
MFVLEHVADALRLAGVMFWQVLWPLALGFLVSAVVETLVPKQAVSRLLGRDSARSVAVAAGLGAASSSCSYAAVAVARTLFRKGATLANAILFEFASTNLVVELGLVLLILLGWQFLAAEVSGGIVMIVLLAVLMHFTLSAKLQREARAQADRGRHGRMEGHAAMDMSLTEGPLLQRAFSGNAATAISHTYFMNVYSLWSDLVLGFLIAGALGAWVPDGAWSALFLNGHGVWTDIWGALIGPLIAVITFVCSVGNVPLAAVLWRGGISFAGAIAFIFADLIILPILNIYRKYYGGRVSVYLFAISLISMVAAGLIIDVIFQALSAVPTSRQVAVLNAGITWNYDTVLDIVFLAITAVLLARFLTTGGAHMLRMMDMAGDSHTDVQRAT